MKYTEDYMPKLKITTALLAVAGISACSTVSTGPTPVPTGPTLVAGAPSAHTSQIYETNTSTAAVTSNTAGAAVIAPVNSGFTLSGTPTLARATGTVNHQTGRIELDDGTYLFIDPDGPDLTGAVADAAGAMGWTQPVTSGAATYDYVNEYQIYYTTGGQQHTAFGHAGIVTGGADMPDGGSATYTDSGTALFTTANLSGVSDVSEMYMDGGTSTVTVDFAAGSATVNMDGFTYMADGLGIPYAINANPIDQVRGTGLVVSGAQLSGGTWVTMKNGVPVSVLGASAVATSEGTFFGYDPSISAPDEVAGIVLINGATQVGIGMYMAD